MRMFILDQSSHQDSRYPALTIEKSCVFLQLLVHTSSVQRHRDTDISKAHSTASFCAEIVKVSLQGCIRYLIFGKLNQGQKNPAHK